MKEYKIRINKELVDVSEELYTAYYKMRRHEKYLEEVSAKNNLSYNQLLEQNYPVEEKMCEPQLLVDDIVVEKIILEKMKLALNVLSEYERMIINELFINGTSIRELSAHLSVPRSTLHDQKDKIINKLRKIIDKI